MRVSGHVVPASGIVTTEANVGTGVNVVGNVAGNAADGAEREERGGRAGAPKTTLQVWERGKYIPT